MKFYCREEGCAWSQEAGEVALERFGAPRCPQHGYVMMTAWAWPSEVHRLDLACGETKKEGFLGIDQQPFEGVDLAWDLDRYPYPFVNDCVDEIYCGHFIEHVENLVAFMEEVYRIMKPGATGTIVAPYWSHVNTWRDPTHRRGIADQTLMFFNREYRERNRKGCYGIKADFEVGYTLELDPGIEGAFPGIKTTMPEQERRLIMQHYVNVVFNIIFTIRKKE